MSALPPKADIGWPRCNVRFVPIADMRNLFDHLVSGQENAVWYSDAKRLGGLEIDH
jgi:hypothetical protein